MFLPVGSTKETKLKRLKSETNLGKSDPKLNQNQKGSKTNFRNLTFFVSLKDTSIKTFVKPALENEILSNTLSCFLIKPREVDSSSKPILQVSSGSGTLTPNIKFRVKGLFR